VYGGNNDATPEYLRKLYAADLEYALNPPSGRNCEDPYPSVGKGGDTYSDGDDGMRDGALTGGFCSRRRWC
jgi:hypothetical protein